MITFKLQCVVCTPEERVCRHHKAMCHAYNGVNWYCTLPEGHDGPHVACRSNHPEDTEHNLDAWNDADTR